jgi:hypothetical protein
VNLEQLGNLGELIGGLAVIASLLFVGFQVRQNTHALKLAQYRGIHDGIRESLRSAESDPQLAEITLRGLNDLTSLNPVERYRFDLLFFGWLGQFELACEANLEGLYPTERLIPFETAIAAWMGTPGGAAWWQERRVWFGPITQSGIDAALAKRSPGQDTAGPPAA